MISGSRIYSRTWIRCQICLLTLHGELTEDVFVEQPQGFEKNGGEENYSCKFVCGWFDFYDALMMKFKKSTFGYIFMMSEAAMNFK